MAELVRFSTCAPVPWKYGTGTTRELWGKRDDTGNVLIRISIAEITGAQAFSVFPGIERVILQLAGPPMTLTINGAMHRLSPDTSLTFHGEANTCCVLDSQSSAQDLNLMCRRGSYRPSIRKIDIKSGKRLRFGDAGEVAALLALTECGIAGVMDATLAHFDLIVTSTATTIMADRDSSFVLLTAVGETDRNR